MGLWFTAILSTSGLQGAETRARLVGAYRVSAASSLAFQHRADDGAGCDTWGPNPKLANMGVESLDSNFIGRRKECALRAGGNPAPDLFDAMAWRQSIYKLVHAWMCDWSSHLYRQFITHDGTITMSRT